MKTLVTSILIFLTISIGLIPASGQPAAENPAKKQQTEKPEHKKIIITSAVAQTEETSDTNAADDPNTVSAETEEAADTNSAAIGPTIEDFEGLSEALKQIDLESRNETRGWTRRTEDKLELILAVQEQITTELNLLRELAVEEGAVKTTAAIDKILLDRQERYKIIIEKFERERERLRREEERGREREERDRERRERSRERPSRNR